VAKSCSQCCGERFLAGHTQTARQIQAGGVGNFSVARSLEKIGACWTTALKDLLQVRVAACFQSRSKGLSDWTAARSFLEEQDASSGSCGLSFQGSWGHQLAWHPGGSPDQVPPHKDTPSKSPFCVVQVLSLNRQALQLRTAPCLELADDVGVHTASSSKHL